VKLDQTVGMIAGNIAAPGFAPALAGKRRAAIVWMGISLGVSLVATLWWVLPFVAIALRLAAGIAGYIETRRLDKPPAWWSALSLAVLVGGLAAYGALRVSIETFKIPSASMYPTLVIGDYVLVDKLSPRWRSPERGEVIVFEQPCNHQPYIKRVIALAGDTVEARCDIVYVNGTPLARKLVAERDQHRDYLDGTWSLREVSRYRETLGDHTYDVFQDRDAPARAATLPGTHDFPPRDRTIAPSCRPGDFYERTSGQPAGVLVTTAPGDQPCAPQLHLIVPHGTFFVMGDNRDGANDSRYWGVVSVDAVIGRAMGVWLNAPPNADRDWARLGAIE
jgi:signal peptidase I